MSEAPRSMEPAEAAQVLRRTLRDPKRPITVADASVASGLALRDAESGLTWLTGEYRGHLRVTEDGDLIHRFPHGFTKPWETRERLGRFMSAVGEQIVGACRFIVRAWLLVVMVSYALVFVALLVAMAMANKKDSGRSHGRGGDALGGLFRTLGEALFWTFHPFSPLRIRGSTTARAPRALRSTRDAPGVPFYEKVDRFVFGPPIQKEEPHVAQARILQEIRARSGRITLADVMRVSGLPRDRADPLMARLMLDHDGSVEVSEGGGIVYRFEALRRSASPSPAGPVAPAWERPPRLRPLTGNGGGANTVIALLNGFNLAASAWFLSGGWTIANVRARLAGGAGSALPDGGMPIVLGLVPFAFSVALFVLPALRALFRGRARRKVDAEKARLAVLREVVTRSASKEPIPDEVLRAAVRAATGVEPTSKEITRRVVELGGDVDIGPAGEVRYRFAEMEADAEAAEDARETAPEEEARVSKVVFASDR